MTVKLDTISLPNMIIENEFNWTGVRTAFNLTLGGTPIIWEQDFMGRALDLISGETDADWITQNTLSSLQILASIAGATYTLNFEGTSMIVRFRNESPPVITAKPVVGRSKKVGYEYYNELRLKLMEV